MQAGNRRATAKILLWDYMRGEPIPCDYVSPWVLESAKTPSHRTHCTQISLRMPFPSVYPAPQWIRVKWYGGPFSVLHGTYRDVRSSACIWLPQALQPPEKTKWEQVSLPRLRIGAIARFQLWQVLRHLLILIRCDSMRRAYMMSRIDRHWSIQ